MPDITTNNPFDPAVLVALKEIQDTTRHSVDSTDNLLEPLEKLLEAIERITER